MFVEANPAYEGEEYLGIEGPDGRLGTAQLSY